MTNRYEIHLEANRRFSFYFLKEHLPPFIEGLYKQGFSQLTIEGYVSSIAHFGTWLKKKDIVLEDITRNTLSDFSKHRCYCTGGRKRHKLSYKYVNRVQRFVDFLHHRNVIKLQPLAVKKISNPIVLRFREHLQARGLAPMTVYNYCHYLLKILSVLGNNPKRYSAKRVKRIVTDYAKTCSISEAKHLITALRSYLRFLAVEGLCKPNLDYAVPTVAQWSLSSIPRYITAQEISRVIHSCDISTNQGLRDRAILLLLARLGLRAGDIVAMRLDDVNWAEGSIRLKGKSKIETKLPLPQEVGEAILDYIKKGRPMVSVEQVFLCLNAPYRPFTSSPCVSSIVDAALTRADISNPPSRGAHLLRHSAATDMLRSGATLETVSSVLRHQSLDMTAYYAKVDITMLEKIAQPWPEGGSC